MDGIDLNYYTPGKEEYFNQDKLNENTEKTKASIEKLVQSAEDHESRLAKQESQSKELVKISGLQTQELLQTKRHIDNVMAEIGTVTLNNTKVYPFNNSIETIALNTPRNTLNYEVSAEVMSTDGEAGEILISEKQTNGFKLAFTGSATTVAIKYFVRGGINA